MGVPDGTIRWNKGKYYYIKIDGRWIPYARYLMNEHLLKNEGRTLTADEAVRFIDGNSENCVLDNLKIIIRPPVRKLNKLNTLDRQIREMESRLSELKTQRDGLFEELYPDEAGEAGELDE